MTREEQTDWLCRLRANLNNGVIFTPWNEEFTEALTGILEQEPSGDLISRSALIKFFEEHMRTAEDFREIIINIIPTIKNQPTAYDIDKVVEELEEAKHEICLSDDDLEHYQNGIDKAIVIVKQGGIFDDMWEYNKDSFAEIACRKLAKLGIVRAKGDEWELVESEASE